MQGSFLLAQTIRTIEIFYYSSVSHIFINTVLLQMISQKYVAQNIQIKKSQISEPTHHSFGEAPFICVNHTHIVKKQRIWDFTTLVLNIEMSRKYEFLSVAHLTQQIAEVSNLYSEYDQNPYFMFISPWKKYKIHRTLQDKKIRFRQNSLFCSNVDDSLNKEYFIYKINSLELLMVEYQKEYATKPQYLRFYKIMTYAGLKHLKFSQDTLYLVAGEMKALKRIEEQIERKLSQKMQRNQNNISLERPPTRNIGFTNVQLKYLHENQEREIKPQQAQAQEIMGAREKINQTIFKPVIMTVLFTLAMWVFK